MAYNSSGTLAVKDKYTLGDYEFQIEVDSTQGPYVEVTARMKKDGKYATKSIQLNQGAKILNWYVEASDETADIYISYQDSAGTATLKSGAPTVTRGQVYAGVNERRFTTTNAQRPILGGVWKRDSNWVSPVLIDTINDVSDNLVNQIRTFKVNGVTFYEQYGGAYNNGQVTAGAFLGDFSSYKSLEDMQKALVAKYFTFSGGSTSSKLVARFEINLQEAGGGYNPDDPYDPEDPGWEEPIDTGDPTYTLKVRITGSRTGSHNSSIFLDEDAYSFTAGDQVSQKGYGEGGDGGHGGGGGAGASTVIAYKFATDKAGSIEVEAFARRHGYGSGGGKGGKGGDGCILIFY